MHTLYILHTLVCAGLCAWAWCSTSRGSSAKSEVTAGLFALGFVALLIAGVGRLSGHSHPALDPAASGLAMTPFLIAAASANRTQARALCLVVACSLAVRLALQVGLVR